MTLRLNDWFCGAGGATQGAHKVPGIVPVLAANHDQLAIDTHSANFPDVEHFRGDIRDLDVAGHPYAEIFWASPECTNWSQAKGKAVDFDGSKQPGLFGDTEVDDDVARSRALMQDVIRYLEGMDLRQQPVLAGVVENVTDIRKWEHWHAWRSRIEGLGYKTRLIALNSMHAQSRHTPRAPQSRDRLYLAYWHRKIGRDPDWDRWLRPSAHCPTCDLDVAAVQSWKRSDADMGRYRQQYVYRCPTVSCRGQIVEPVFVPAAAAIDWTLPGERIGDKKRPLAPKTLARIKAGIEKYARPVVIRNNSVRPGDDPAYLSVPAERAMGALTTAGHQSLAVPMLVPPLLVPVEGREGKQAASAGEHLRTQTARNETGLLIPPMLMRAYTPRGGGGLGGQMLTPATEAARALTASSVPSLVVPPFITELWGTATTRPIAEALATVSAEGNHHFLTVPQATMAAWAALYGYDGGQLRDHQHEPLPTQTTVQGDGLLSGTGLPAVEDCLFRMLEPHEIHAGMAFVPDYIVLGNKRQKVKQLGNAVTPPVAEVLVSALVECITGEAVAA